jgi:WD40 repeat protein
VPEEDPKPAPPPDAALAATLSLAPLAAAVDTTAEGEIALLLHVVAPDEYAVSGELGRGGLGRVLSARHKRMGRTVALKELLPGREGAVDRFLREALVTARLQHPSIVPIYDAGCWPTGAPFYTMKRADGRSLAELIAQRPHLDDRLALLPAVLAAADAIAYAHSQRVIHRDLKPANVLVGEFGETLVIDWGLAKALGDEAPAPGEPERGGASGRWAGAADAGSGTVAGTILGTPAYMPPEQARGDLVDERADVYALGAVLYHVLAGVAPYGSASSEETLERVLAGPPLALATREPAAPPELVAIVDQAMAREPARRYPTAKGLVADLARFQTGQLVAAHRYSRTALVARWLRRHRAVVSVATLALLALLVVGGVSLRRIIRAEGHASARARELVFEQGQALLERDPTATLAWLRVYLDSGGDPRRARSLAAEAWSRGVYRHALRQASAIHEAGFLGDGEHLITSSMDEAGLRIWDLHTGGSRRLEAPPLLVMMVDHRGRQVAGCDGEDKLRVYDVATGAGKLLPHRCSHVSFPRFSHDDRLIVVEGDDQRMHLFDIERGEERPLPALAGDDSEISPDGRSLLVQVDGGIEIWTLASGARTRLDAPADADHVAWSASGERLAIAWADGSTRVFEVSGAPVRTLAGSPSHSHAELSPDGRWLVEVERPRPRAAELRLWDLESGESRFIGRQQKSFIQLEFTPDSRRLIAAVDDYSLAVIRIDDGSSRPLAVSDLQNFFLQSPDGRRLLARNGFEVRLWDLDDGIPELLWPHGSKVPRGDVAISRDERQAGVIDEDGRVHVVDLASGARRTLGQVALPTNASAGVGPTNWDARLGFAPDGRSLAATAVDGSIHLFALDGGAERVLAGHQGTVFGLCFTPDGRVLFSAGKDGTVRAWDLATGAGRVLGEGPSLRVLALSPSGRWLASGDKSGGVKLWDAGTGRLERTLDAGENLVLSLAFSPDERQLAAGSYDHILRLWDLGSGRLQSFSDHTDYVEVVTFSPDGTLLASAGGDHGVHLRDLRRGTTRTLLGHESQVHALAFSPDGTRLVSGDAGGRMEARLWQLDTGQGRSILHEASLKHIWFSRDGRHVYSGGYELRRWTDDLPDDAPGLRAWIDAHTDEVAPALVSP